jgi:hypothetical protein
MKNGSARFTTTNQVTTIPKTGYWKSATATKSASSNEKVTPGSGTGIDHALTDPPNRNFLH